MALERFIVEAKAVSYVSGQPSTAAPTRTGAHDISYQRGAFSYLDSYFGGTDFLGQEVVWKDGAPIWAMNYYGRILDPERFDGERAGTVIKQALSALTRRSVSSAASAISIPSANMSISRLATAAVSTVSNASLSTVASSTSSTIRAASSSRDGPCYSRQSRENA